MHPKTYLNKKYFSELIQKLNLQNFLSLKTKKILIKNDS